MKFEVFSVVESTEKDQIEVDSLNTVKNDHQWIQFNKFWMMQVDWNVDLFNVGFHVGLDWGLLIE